MMYEFEICIYKSGECELVGFFSLGTCGLFIPLPRQILDSQQQRGPLVNRWKNAGRNHNQSVCTAIEEIETGTTFEMDRRDQEMKSRSPSAPLYQAFPRHCGYPLSSKFPLMLHFLLFFRSITTITILLISICLACLITGYDTLSVGGGKLPYFSWSCTERRSG